MGRWSSGEAQVEQLLRSGQLQSVSGGQASGDAWLVKARRTLATARRIVEQDPDSSVVLAYDAARHGCLALLAQQGLRSTTAGGHYAVEQVVRAQFGAQFREFGALRRRRNELEYPTQPGTLADRTEAADAVISADSIVTAAEKLLPHLGLFM